MKYHLTLYEIHEHLVERIEYLTHNLKYIQKTVGTNCVGYGYADGAREEMVALKEMMEGNFD